MSSKPGHEQWNWMTVEHSNMHAIRGMNSVFMNFPAWTLVHDTSPFFGRLELWVICIGCRGTCKQHWASNYSVIMSRSPNSRWTDDRPVRSNGHQDSRLKSLSMAVLWMILRQKLSQHNESITLDVQYVVSIWTAREAPNHEASEHSCQDSSLCTLNMATR